MGKIAVFLTLPGLKAGGGLVGPWVISPEWDVLET